LRLAAQGDFTVVRVDVDAGRRGGQHAVRLQLALHHRLQHGVVGVARRGARADFARADDRGAAVEVGLDVRGAQPPLRDAGGDVAGGGGRGDGRRGTARRNADVGARRRVVLRLRGRVIARRGGRRARTRVGRGARLRRGIALVLLFGGHG